MIVPSGLGTIWPLSTDLLDNTYDQFLDALGDRALAGTTAIPVMAARTPRHALAPDVHLRPLLIELGASCPTPSICALESRLSNPGAVCGAWMERARPALEHLTVTD